MSDAERMLEPTRAEIKEVVDELAEDVRINPSNAELMIMIEKGNQALQNHAADDKVVSEGIHARMKTVDEKQDLILKQQADTMELLKAISTGKKVLLFTWNNYAKIGGFIIFMGAIFAFFKFGFLALYLALTGKQ